MPDALLPPHSPRRSCRQASRWGLIALSAALAACTSLEPAHQVPEVAVGAQFKEAAGVPGWVPAQPGDGADRGLWWQPFGDDALNRLLPQVEVSNQTVAAAVARLDAAQALVAGQSSARLPQVQATAGASRSGRGDGGAVDTRRIGLAADWELDLWGRLRAGVHGAQAQAAVSAAELAAARLSAQTTLARNLLQLRATDAESELLRATVEAYARSLQIANNRYAAGQVARTDVLLAQTQLANARADLSALDANRRVLEHALAVLLGQAPSAFSLERAAWNQTVPTLPAALPSELLQRRPDVAAAERQVAAANAQIGIARSAFYPSLGLSASLGSEGPRLSDLFDAPNLLWALGVSVAQSVFDGGSARAGERQARAAHTATVADYRQTVLSALQSVEDLLATRRALNEQLGLRREASSAADQSEQQVLNRYKAGQLSFAEVVAAQATALNARRNVVQVQASLQANTVSLVQALGGGWSSAPP